jgi:hypothetical protein
MLRARCGWRAGSRRGDIRAGAVVGRLRHVTALLVLASSAAAAGAQGPSVRPGVPVSGKGDVAAVPAVANAGPWKFRVLLDGKPIGHHHFTLQQGGDARTLKSEARFDVKLLGLTVYSYRHTATEHWQGGCLAELDARTDDDGTVSTVQARREGEALTVTGTQGSRSLEGCVLSFAYWNPSILDQTRLLNAQTGKEEAVRIESLGIKNIEVADGSVPARHYRITGVDQPIELWYSQQGDWLALESTVSRGRRLSYRRE